MPSCWGAAENHVMQRFIAGRFHLNCWGAECPEAEFVFDLSVWIWSS